jgi:membrane protease YdiL (CAAX protease family)
MHEPFPRLDEPPPEPPRALWGVREMAICVGFVLVALFLITSIIVGPFLAAYGEDAPETLTANAVANLVWNASMIVAVLWFVRRAGANRGDLGLRLPDGMGVMKVIALAAATFVVMYLIVVAYGVAIELFGFDFLEPDQQVPDEFYDSDVALAVLGIAIVFGAPLTEEIFFRGFLFGGTRPLTGVLAAALITGFLFSLAHYNPGLVVPFTLIGALLALSYHRSGTLFVPMGAHFFFNLVSFSVLAFFPEARPE